MLIPHDIQINLLWFAELLFCAVTLLCARLPQHRSACLIVFTMGAIDLALWDFFEGISGDPNKYRAYLAITLIFMNANILIKAQNISRNLIFLIVLSLLHYLEWRDIATNPDPSFIDYNYALFVALTYLLYSISMTGVLKDAWKHFRRYNRFSGVNNLSLDGRSKNIKDKERLL